MNGEQLGVTPRIHFGGSALTLSFLGKILDLLNEHGQIDVRGIAPGTVNLLELGAVLHSILPRTMIQLERGLAGQTPRERLRRKEVSLWIPGPRKVLRTFYKHKLLRYDVTVDQAEHDFIA